MNELPDDDAVIARLRSALDEITAAPAAARPMATASHDGLGGARWFAIAAATILVIGAVTAVIVNRSHRTPAASSATDVTTTVVQTTTVLPTTTLPTTTLPAPTGDVWYTLASQDLVPGEVIQTPCCPPMPAPGPNTVMAWAATTGFEDGVFLLLAQPTTNGEPVLKFMSYGFSDARTEQLKAEVVPGSGLPYVLPDDSMELVGFGLDGVGAQRSQQYSNATGSVTITVGDYRGQLTPLVLGAGFHPVTIAGRTGYRYLTEAGDTRVVWRTPAGTWATLDITATLADRVDGLIAAVAEQSSNTPTATSVPAPAEPVYRGVVTSIIDTGGGPMLAFGLRDSLPPQGGDLPLLGFDWAMVDDEQTVNGTTWTGPHTVTGTWDGTSFTLTEAPTPSLPGRPTAPSSSYTPGCTLESIQPVLDGIAALDWKGLHLLSWSADNTDGHCGAAVQAAIDTPELQAAMAPFGDTVTLTLALELVG